MAQSAPDYRDIMSDVDDDEEVRDANEEAAEKADAAKLALEREGQGMYACIVPSLSLKQSLACSSHLPR